MWGNHNRSVLLVLSLHSCVYGVCGVGMTSLCSSLQPTPVILLKEGTDTSQGIPQLVSNINACQVIAEAVRTTLGPRGMDKLIVDDRGVSFTPFIPCALTASQSPVQRCTGMGVKYRGLSLR